MAPAGSKQNNTAMAITDGSLGFLIALLLPTGLDHMGLILLPSFAVKQEFPTNHDGNGLLVY
jgi:hypothetical protein